MALVDPRIYSWVPNTNWPSHPFVTGEGLGSPRYPFLYHLLAADRRRVPFPRSILRQERYWLARSARVRLFVQEGNSPYAGASHYMEIQLSGERSLTSDVSDLMRRISPGIPRMPHVNPLLGGIGQGIMSIFRPSPLAGEAHWTRRYEREAGNLTVRYTYLPPM
jgi:hypothetical protein